MDTRIRTMPPMEQQDSSLTAHMPHSQQLQQQHTGLRDMRSTGGPNATATMHTGALNGTKVNLDSKTVKKTGAGTKGSGGRVGAPTQGGRKR